MKLRKNDKLDKELLSSKKEVKITYRGWPGHFCCSDRCTFHLNTLLELDDVRIVVSTVGLMKNCIEEEINQGQKFMPIGLDRYFETMAFHAYKCNEFWDADVSRQISFDSEWSYPDLKDEWKANKGHIKVVEEIKEKMEKGIITNVIE